MPVASLAYPPGREMHAEDLYFVIPTYRLRDVGETVEHYDEHFWRNGHSPTLIVFDDSSPAAQEKYYPLLEQTQHAQRAVLRRPAGEGTVPRLPEPPAARQAARRARQEPVPAELRRQPQLYADVHARRADDLVRRRYAARTP